MASSSASVGRSEFDLLAPGQLPQELIVFRMVGPAADGQRQVRRQGLDEPVDPLVGQEPADEEDAVAGRPPRRAG